MTEIKNNQLYLGKFFIGTVIGNTLVMHRVKSKHYYKVLNAWCLNVETVNCGVDKFEVLSSDGELYKITLDQIKKLRSKLNMWVTYGNERQLAIPVACWDWYESKDNEFPSRIGQPADEFVDNATGRWRSRLIAFSQIDLQLG